MTDKENQRQQQIYDKGFDMFSSSFGSYGLNNGPLEYNKIKVGVKTLDNAILDLSLLPREDIRRRGLGKTALYRALFNRDLEELRRISKHYYDISGIYKRTCDYFAFLYRYDWYITPEIYDDSAKEKDILKNFSKTLKYLDNSYLKKLFGQIALDVIVEGCYYGYQVPSSEGLVLQKLPVKYCRSRYSIGQNPAVEFNMKFFDTFSDLQYRMKVLKLFPSEFQKGYMLYKQNKLISTETGDSESGWYLLDPENTIKFNFNNSDVPIFINSIPSIIDLVEAQDLDRRKQMQKLLKILIQKLPLDKNGDLIFDVDEARDIHNNAVEMLRNAIGVDVLTTFTDVLSIDLSDKNTTASQDDLQKVERSLFNTLGISRNLFNTDGNLSLEKSILNDESTVRNLLLQFSCFMDRVVKKNSPSSKKYNFKIYFLETTQYNYQNLSKLYKEQTQIGYSKMLPQIALGHSQSFILNSVTFENEILHLSEIMIPPLMSSTLSGEDILGKKDSSTSSQNQNKSNEAAEASTETKQAGRPQKEDSEKSEKTIQNIESKS